MTTFNTGNPIGSTNVKDLYDNAENFDVAANSRASRTWIDRLGVPRKTWWGMEQDFQDFLLSSGYVDIGDYGPGLTITARNQIFAKDGELYRAGPGLALPYTTTGDWATEGSNFVAMGDAILRQDLANPADGANIVGYRSGVTVRQGLDTLESGLAQANQDIIDVEKQNARLFGSGLDAATIDMHFGVLRGRGWTAGDPPWDPSDPQNIHSTTATTAVGTGSTDIPIASAADFSAGMLICYLGVDGRYHSAKLHEIVAGSVFRLGHRLPVAISSGAPIYNFYRDNAHPNTYGGAAIVDAAISKLSNDYRIRHFEARISDGLSWSPYNGGTVATYSTLSYSNPAETDPYRRAITLTTNGVGQGAQSTIVGLTGGDYVACVNINCGLRTGGFSGELTVAISEFTRGGESYVIATYNDFGYDSVQSVEIPFSVSDGSSVRIIAYTANGAEQVSRLGGLSIYKLGNRLAPINRGKHVLFGDSWFSVGSAMATRFIARLDEAQVVVKGVSGNKASDMLARFGADVAAERPDYVWVMVGTNDYYAGVTPALFEQQILQIRRLIQSIGAQPIIFNASVGSITYSPPQLNPSRQYALRVRNETISPQANAASSTRRNATFSSTSISIPAGSGVVVGVSPGMTTGDAVLRSLYVSVPALTATLGYSGSVAGTGVIDATGVKQAGESGANNRIAPRTTDREPRFAVLRLHNASGSAVTAAFSADILWNERN
jgi:hypothetical protein